jgi:putative acetyltransferase
MQASIEILPASCGDLARLFEVRNQSAFDGCRHVYTPEQLRVWLSRPLPNKVSELLTQGNVLVAKAHNEIIGEIIGYGALDPTDKVVEAVFVIPAYAGKGVGRALLDAVESLAQKLDLGELQLLASLNAVPFYRKAGYVFIEHGELPLTESLVLEYEKMEKRLGSAISKSDQT